MSPCRPIITTVRRAQRFENKRLKNPKSPAIPRPHSQSSARGTTWAERQINVSMGSSTKDSCCRWLSGAEVCNPAGQLRAPPMYVELRRVSSSLSHCEQRRQCQLKNDDFEQLRVSPGNHSRFSARGTYNYILWGLCGSPSPKQAPSSIAANPRAASIEGLRLFAGTGGAWRTRLSTLSPRLGDLIAQSRDSGKGVCSQLHRLARVTHGALAHTHTHTHTHTYTHTRYHTSTIP